MFLHDFAWLGKLFHDVHKRPDISAKQTCISAKVTYTSSKEPYISAKEPYTSVPYQSTCLCTISIQHCHICLKRSSKIFPEMCVYNPTYRSPYLRKRGVYRTYECVAHAWVTYKLVAHECVAYECVTHECVAHECVTHECVAYKCVAHEQITHMHESFHTSTSRCIIMMYI